MSMTRIYYNTFRRATTSFSLLSMVEEVYLCIGK